MDSPEAKPSTAASSRSLNRNNTRHKLVRCGTEIFCERGFQSTGIEEILQRVGIPKGSFYHFFGSKRDFGLGVIDNYAEYFEKKLARVFSNTELQPLEQIVAFVDEAKRGMRKYDFRRGCLVGNLSQELAALDDDFRIRLEQVLQSWEEHLASCLDRAVAAGQLPMDTDAPRLAQFFWIGWEGAILRAKLTRNDEPLDKFMALFWKAARRSSF